MRRQFYSASGKGTAYFLSRVFLRLRDEPREIQILRLRNFQKGVERRFEVPAFHMADARSTQTGLLCQRLLRPAAFLAFLAKHFNDSIDGLGMEINAHGRDAMDLPRQRLRPYMATTAPPREQLEKAHVHRQ